MFCTEICQMFRLAAEMRFGLTSLLKPFYAIVAGVPGSSDAATFSVANNRCAEHTGKWSSKMERPFITHHKGRCHPISITTSGTNVQMTIAAFLLPASPGKHINGTWHNQRSPAWMRRWPSTENIICNDRSFPEVVIAIYFDQELRCHYTTAINIGRLARVTPPSFLNNNGSAVSFGSWQSASPPHSSIPMGGCSTRRIKMAG